MADCNEYQVPAYAPAPPVINENCLGSCSDGGVNIISPPDPSGAGKTTEILAGFSISVVDLSDIYTDRFEINYSPYTNVDVTLTILAKALGVTKTNPVLKGTTIDEVACSWNYNAARDGDITAQTLENSGAGADPPLTATDRDYTYTTQTITTDATVEITGGDGISQDSDSKSITFGNYLAWGVSDPSPLDRDPSEFQNMFNNLSTKAVRTTQQNYSFDAFGSETEYMVIAYPASWGDSRFTKNNITGGYKRIYWVTRATVDMIVDEILAGDVVNDIDIDNGNGFTEPMIFYMSEWPERTADFPTIMTKA